MCCNRQVIMVMTPIMSGLLKLFMSLRMRGVRLYGQSFAWKGTVIHLGRLIKDIYKGHKV